MLEAYKDTTFLPPDKLAALFAPGLFERGPAVTTEERIPPFTFIPDLAGDARLGRLWDVETATLTKAVLRLSEDKHMHTAFCGDTGFGKTVGAERLCVEVVNQWHHRAVVFDWGQGWRKLFTSPLPKERVVIYQLHARAVNPAALESVADRPPHRSGHAMAVDGRTDCERRRAGTETSELSAQHPAARVSRSRGLHQ